MVDVNGDGITDVGDGIVWTITVTNVGTRTVTGIKVGDRTAGPVTCPSTALAPGQSMTCTTVEHIITAADAARGTVRNTALVAANDIKFAPPPAHATVVVRTPPATPTPPANTGTGRARASTGFDARLGLIWAALLIGAGGLLAIGGTRRRRLQ